jgi:hypothetical protein
MADRFFFGIKKHRRTKGIERISKYNVRLRTLLKTSADRPTTDDFRSIPKPDGHHLNFSLREKMAELPRSIAKLWCKCADAGHHILIGLFQPWNSNPVMLDLVVDLSETSNRRRWSESTLTICLDQLVLHHITTCPY